jgi:hypothetical protein
VQRREVARPMSEPLWTSSSRLWPLAIAVLLVPGCRGVAAAPDSTVPAEPRVACLDVSVSAAPRRTDVELRAVPMQAAIFKEFDPTDRVFRFGLKYLWEFRRDAPVTRLASVMLECGSEEWDRSRESGDWRGLHPRIVVRAFALPSKSTWSEPDLRNPWRPCASLKRN